MCVCVCVCVCVCALDVYTLTFVYACAHVLAMFMCTGVAFFFLQIPLPEKPRTSEVGKGFATYNHLFLHM